MCISVNKSLCLCKNNRNYKSTEVKSGNIKHHLCQVTENLFVVLKIFENPF